MAEKKEVSADKLKVLNAVLDKIEKDFGKGAVMRMSSDKVEGVQYIRFPAAAQYPLMGLLCEEESLAYQLPVLLLLDYFRAG